MPRKRKPDKLKALLVEQAAAQAALDAARHNLTPLVIRADEADEAVSDYLNELCEQAMEE